MNEKAYYVLLRFVNIGIYRCAVFFNYSGFQV